MLEVTINCTSNNKQARKTVLTVVETGTPKLALNVCQFVDIDGEHEEVLSINLDLDKADLRRLANVLGAT